VLHVIYTPMHTGPRRAHGHAQRVCMWNARSNGLQTRANRTHAAWAMQCVRIDWHVNRPTNKKVKRRAVQSQAGEALARRREQIECTQLQLSGSARTAGSVVVFAKSADPIGFRTSTRDVEAQSAAKEHTSEARGDDRGPGVGRWSR